MIKKSDIVRDAVEKMDWKKALKIAKDFRLGISQDDHNAMTRAYECMVHPRFYESLGMNMDGMIKTGISVVTKLYGRKEQEV